MTEEIRAKHYDVFVSYKREDDEAREVLCEALRKAGFEFWYDGKLRSGNFRQQLRDEINRSDVVIALWSPRTAAKPDEVLAEMHHALELKRLLPVRVDGAPIPQLLVEQPFFALDLANGSASVEAQLEAIIAEAKR